jgi:uncharacterized protein DUF2637
VIEQLKRIRWAVRAVLGLGILASTAANVLHAEPNAISRTIAGWPPVALFITLELISKVPTGRRVRKVAKLAATALIAGIAAWVSYWHMAAVAARYGETGASPYLLPLSVDGMIVVATICLVELADRIRELATVATPEPVVVQVATPATVATRPVATGHDEPATRPPATRRAPPATPVATRLTGRDATTAAIATLRRGDPAISQRDVATRLDIGLRTVGRYWSATAPAPATPVNGRVPDLKVSA